VAPEVKELLKRYRVAELWVDRKNRMDQENAKLLNEKYQGVLPLYLVFTPEGQELARLGGTPSVREFVEFLKKGLPPETGAR